MPVLKYQKQILAADAMLFLPIQNDQNRTNAFMCSFRLVSADLVLELYESSKKVKCSINV